MQSIVVELDRHSEPEWLEELIHEFTEDPYCSHLLLGADEDTVMLVTIWADAVAPEVQAGVTAMLGSEGSVRRFELSIPSETPQ